MSKPKEGLVPIIITEGNVKEFIDFLHGAYTTYSKSVELCEHFLSIFYSHLNQMKDIDKLVAFVEEARKDKRLPTDKEFIALKTVIAQSMGLAYKMFQKKETYENFLKLQESMHQKIALQLHTFTKPLMDSHQ